MGCRLFPQHGKQIQPPQAPISLLFILRVLGLLTTNPQSWVLHPAEKGDLSQGQVFKQHMFLSTLSLFIHFQKMQLGPDVVACTFNLHIQKAEAVRSL